MNGVAPATLQSSQQPPPSSLKLEDGVPAVGRTIEVNEVTSPDSLKYDEEEEEEESESSDDDEIQYCDCIAVALSKSLPGTPGKKGIIPYTSIYETQAEARKRGYWIPGVPVNAKIIKVEKNTDSGIHFINTLKYTIELEHGKFKWSVIRNYKDFTLLNNRLMAHRAAERIRAPVRRLRGHPKVVEAQERVDSFLEGMGVDIISDHKEDCPYYKKQHRKKTTKMQLLKREADNLGGENSQRQSHNGTVAPLALTESPLTPPEDEIQMQRISMDEAVQSGILQDSSSGTTRNSEPPAKRTGRTMASVEEERPEVEENSTKKPKTRTRKKHTLPPFPRLPDYMVTDIESRKEQLENWLQMLLHIPINRNHHETAEFLEISRFSFVNDLGGKHTEGFVKKRPGGSRVFLGCRQFCVRYLVPWSKRWLMVRDSFVAYMDHRTEQIRMVLLMDKDFKVAAGGREAEGIPTGLIITNAQHELHLKCRRIQDTTLWKQIIEQSMASQMGNIWIQPHRFASSFPVRENAYGKWFVDAREYMSFAADMMELAREEIFIADWWLSPEIYMKRPALAGTKWRLDQILQRKAEQGVKIFILLYKEMEMALGLNSIYTKRTLQGLHPNIRVMRHPDHSMTIGTFFWAHHEKLIVVDQLISFVGGVDLCFGRWDDEHHLLTDLGSVQFAGQHAFQDHSMAAGLRALVKAPLTLGPLGLEENEIVVPRGEQNTPNPAAGDSSSSTADPTTVRHVTTINVGENGEDEVDSHILRQIGEGEEEAVYADKETGNVRVRIWKKATPQAAKIAKERHSSPIPEREKERANYRTQASVPTPTTAGKRSTSLFRVVREAEEANKRKSASMPRKLPMEMLDRAGPAPSMFEKAAKSGMDLATAAEKYKEYVASGAVRREKHRAQTPPMNRKESRVSRAVSNWKSNRAKRKWKQVLDNDEVMAGYELEWLRLQSMVPEEDVDGGTKLWIGKDYVNYIHKDFVDINMPFHDFVDRGITPRMPWHDIHSVTYGVPARDVARHFIQRWNATKTEKLKDDTNYPFLLPKSYENLKVPRMFRSPPLSEAVNVQVLRSLSHWSGLINQTEDSIQMAYLSLIANSKHYLYIENQFFVSLIDVPEVMNEICKVICNRIIRAYKEKTKYRVYIMIPLLPGFEGDVGAPGGSSLQAVLHWTYQSLSRGPNSLVQRLKAVVPDPFEYLHIGSLRTHDILCGKLVTELIYIHCKLIIVDDEYVIIGSANINDRSQVGNRDSEVCLLFQDLQHEKSTMDGKPYQAGKFAKSLRLRCMKEHLGLLPNERRPAKFRYDVTCDDPVADDFFIDIWQSTARTNTRIYEEVFRAYPTDNVETFEEYKMWTSQMPLAEYQPPQAEERLRDLRGTLVEFPLNFLSKAVLTPGITSKEGLVPNSVFT